MRVAFAVDLTGSILDRRYRITGLLGKGGMGHVYEAVHVALEQRVAVKVLHPRYAYEERFRERFLQEARAASKIRHRNVVEIKDFGETPDGSVYFVMEYLGGHDVGVELQEHGPLPWSRTRHILLQAASALHAAHAKHIIHRDIKPGNCFLIEDQAAREVDVVKLLDFGIAKVGSDSYADAQGKGLTGTGEVFGTASYMSPEQARSETLDARSDLYSLGIMAYEMLTGQVPFIGVNAIHVITQHLNGKPEPLRSLDPGIPTVVEALVLKMIAKAPRDRYASMEALEQALRAIPEVATEKVRRTRLWSSPGELRALVEEKKAGSVGVLPPGGVATGPRTSPVAGAVAVAAGTDAERTAMVLPATPPVEQRGVKRTVVSMERPAGPEAHVAPSAAVASAPVPGAPAPALAPSFGAPAAASSGAGLPVAASGSGPQPNVPASGPMGWATTERADGTNPPPGRDDSFPPPSTWPPSTASTGPHGRVGDTGTETRPHSLGAVQASGISRRLLLVVGLLVILVGGGSAVGTMMFLSKRGGREQPAGVVEPVAAEDPAPAGDRVEDGERPVDVGAPVLEEVVASKVDAPSPAPAVAVAPAVEGVSDDSVLESDGHVDEPANEGVQAGDVADPSVSVRPEDPQPPKLPRHETEKCARAREAARTALDQRKWAEAAKHARQKECWASGEQSARRHIQVNALLEMGRFADCIAAGSGATAVATVKLVEICRKKVPK